ncbi:MAG: ABC transporter substrate-binding protein [Nevskiales bacterium]
MAAMLRGRRDVLKAAASLGAAATLARPAIAQARRKITIVVGTPTIDSATDDFFAGIPIGAGFYAEEGLDVDVQTSAGSTAAVSLLMSGQAQFCTHGTPGLFYAVDHALPIKGVICPIPDYFVSVAVDEAGPIKSIADLRGKTIGVNAQGGAPYYVIRAVIRKLGMNPDTDVNFLAVGTTLPALDALRRNRVKALVEWDTIFALFEFNGAKLRYFRPDPLPSLGFTHTTNTQDSTIEREPAMVAGVCRAIAKSIVMLAAAEPAELTRLHYKVFPASKPTGLSEDDILRLDGQRQAARRQFMRYQQQVFDRTEKIGDATDAQIEGQRDLLFSGGEIKNQYPPDRYFTRRFIDQANAFDVPAMITRAKAFRA